MDIQLNELIPIENTKDYKVHLACWNGDHEPLDVFVRSRDEWDGWNSYRGQRDDFNRNFILSLMNFYHEQHVWLFGGIYRVMDRTPDEYIIQLDQETKKFVGRLKIFLPRPGRAKAVKLENYFDRMLITELLKEPYSGDAFGGYDSINISFRNLEHLVNIDKPDWKAALENVKGIYLITDTSNGKRYVGSAYGESGIWSRWTSYVGSVHGENDELKKLITTKGRDYARENFRFALLEYRSMKDDDDTIIERENYWKETLLSRGEFGYNRN